LTAAAAEDGLHLVADNDDDDEAEHWHGNTFRAEEQALGTQLQENVK
jgi:hypothetical protein